MHERNVYKDGSVSVSLIAYKSKVVPLNARKTPQISTDAQTGKDC